jgi:type IV secretion system protein TrbL
VTTSCASIAMRRLKPYLIIVGCFFVMACQICLAVIEYYLVVTLATCLIPFGVSSHTKFIAEKAIGASVAVSVKLMVLSFLVALIQPVLGQIHFSGGGDIKMNELMAMILVSGLLACVVWLAPGLAADLLAGSPSLGAAAIAQHVGTGASMASGAITGAVGAARFAATALAGGQGGVPSAAQRLASGARGNANGWRLSLTGQGPRWGRLIERRHRSTWPRRRHLKATNLGR